MRIKFTGEKSDKVKGLYSSLLDILSAVGIPVESLSSDRRREKMAGACLATGQIVSSLKEAKSVMNGVFMKTRDIIEFENTHYGEQISPGSYDDIRRKDLKMLVEEGIVINSSSLDHSATNCMGDGSVDCRNSRPPCASQWIQVSRNIQMTDVYDTQRTRILHARRVG